MAREILKLTIIIVTSVCFPTDNTFSKYFKYFCKYLLFAVYQYLPRTNLQLGDLRGEHLQLHHAAAAVAVLREDDQPDLAPGVEAGHRELRADGRHVGQHQPAEAVHNLEDKDLIEAAIIARLTLDLEQLRGLRKLAQILMSLSTLSAHWL